MPRGDMKLSEFIVFCAEKFGLNASQSVAVVVRITGAAVRTVWHWHDIGREPEYAQRLMRIWAECPAVWRERWFPDED